MKKQTITLTTLGLLAILSCGLIFYISCRNKDNDCNGCYLTQQELNIISFYKKGDISVFKNDITGIYDTLHVKEIDGFLTTCSYPCNEGDEDINVHVVFSHLNECILAPANNSKLGIGYTNEICNCSGTSITVQSITVNGTNYNDVYIPSIDSTKITSAYHNSMPWKIAYSVSNGIIRCYMLNGQTWSKL